jgi:hypothetical protein
VGVPGRQRLLQRNKEEKMRTSIMGKFATGLVAMVAGVALHWSGLEPAVRAGEPGVAPPNAGAAAEKKLNRYPIRGKLKAVDLAAQTFTLSGMQDRVFKATSQTEILKDGRPATLADARVGEDVGGLAQQQADGSVVALKVRFGPKTEEEKKDSKTPKRTPRAENPKTAEMR